MNQPFEKILTLTDIDEITEVINHFLKRPVVVEDEHFSLLAYSSFNIDQFDEANKQTIFTKRWTIPILEKFMANGIVDQLTTIPEPFRIHPIKEIGLNQRIVVSAKHQDKVFGYIWVQETDELLTESELTFLHEVSNHIGKLLDQKKRLKLRRSERHDEFYKKVMKDMYQTEKQIKWEAANVNIVLPDAFVINIFTVGQKSEDIFDVLEEKVRLFANALSFPTHIFIDKLRIIVIIGGNLSLNGKLTESSNELTNMVLSQFKQQTIYAGISKEYDSVLQLRQAYFEALEVIKAAKFIGPLELLSYEYKNLGVFRYIEAISDYNSKINYHNESLIKLQKKDEESQTSLVRTLEAFLINNCRMKQTAEKLFIHPNTLKYRLNQITEITSINLDDFHTNCLLYIDLQLLKRND